jgi:hypothetical protein
MPSSSRSSQKRETGWLEEIDREYEGRHTDARFVRLLEKGKGQKEARAEAGKQSHPAPGTPPR